MRAVACDPVRGAGSPVRRLVRTYRARGILNSILLPFPPSAPPALDLEGYIAGFLLALDQSRPGDGEGRSRASCHTLERVVVVVVVVVVASAAGKGPEMYRSSWSASRDDSMLATCHAVASGKMMRLNRFGTSSPSLNSFQQLEFSF